MAEIERDDIDMLKGKQCWRPLTFNLTFMFLYKPPFQFSLAVPLQVFAAVRPPT